MVAALGAKPHIRRHHENTESNKTNKGEAFKVVPFSKSSRGPLLPRTSFTKICFLNRGSLFAHSRPSTANDDQCFPHYSNPSLPLILVLITTLLNRDRTPNTHTTISPSCTSRTGLERQILPPLFHYTKTMNLPLSISGRMQSICTFR